MSDDEARPFLAAQQRDVVGGLAGQYARGVNAAVFGKIAAALDPEQVKIDGKGGSLDGALAGGSDVAMGPIGPPFCFAYPGLPPKSKEGKDFKEDKEGKDSKDGKEGKEGKDSKDGKEDKDTSDVGKLGGEESQDPFTRLGDPAELPIASFDAIARTHPERVQLAVDRGSLF
jgi:hypothetical protein